MTLNGGRCSPIENEEPMHCPRFAEKSYLQQRLHHGMSLPLPKRHQAIAPAVQNVADVSCCFGNAYAKYFDSTAAHNSPLLRWAYFVSFGFPQLLALQERSCKLDPSSKAAASGSKPSLYSLAKSLRLLLDDRRRVTRTGKTMATSVNTNMKEGTVP